MYIYPPTLKVLPERLKLALFWFRLPFLRCCLEDKVQGTRKRLQWLASVKAYIITDGCVQVNRQMAGFISCLFCVLCSVALLVLDESTIIFHKLPVLAAKRLHVVPLTNPF